MSTSFITGFCLMGALCIICLTASIAVLIKAQELHNRCLDILYYAHNWLELCREKEEEHE